MNFLRDYLLLSAVGLLGAFMLVVAGTFLLMRWAPGAGLIDEPNQRSSHERPTARGGGVAIVLAVLLLAGMEAGYGLLSGTAAAVLGVGGGAVAAVGLADDRWNLKIRIRLLVHVAAALVAVIMLGDLPPQPAGPWTLSPGLVMVPVLVLSVVWLLNLFNFMDGVDGIAASETVFVCTAGGVLVALTDGTPGILILLMGTAGAALGFLVWNWAPARIFLGDVGSGFLGYVLAVMALIATHESGVPIWAWVTLMSLFIADATVTLLRRVYRGDRWYAAHRSHAYQQLSRRWGSHSRVTLCYVGANVILLFPLALASTLWPRYALMISVTCLAVSSVAMFRVGAGTADG